jgi:hypothetical protein
MPRRKLRKAEMNPNEEATVDRFVKLAQRLSSVSVEDLRQMLPIDAMTVEDISNVIVRLEERDIVVEIDPALFSPKHNNLPVRPAANSKRAQTRLPNTIADMRLPASLPAVAARPVVTEPVGRRSSKFSGPRAMLVMVMEVAFVTAVVFAMLVLANAWLF